MRVLGPLVLLSAAVLGATAPALGLVRFDFDQRYFIEPGYIVKDHSLVRDDDGTLHLFYIRADESIPNSPGLSLGHATSTDLRHWEIHPAVIPVVPGTWESAGIWAPHIVKVGAVWFMYYTGVNGPHAQAIGLATSLDLFNWTKNPGNPVYKPSTTWASWDPTRWSNCRDPYVFEDGGVYYMTTTATTLDSRGAISLASSTNMTTWTDLGPLFIHPGPTQAWRVWESTNLVRKDGVYHLFLTEQLDPGASWMSAPTLYGPWAYDNLDLFDPGHATEVFQLDGQWMLSRHTTFTFDGGARYVIKFDELDWEGASKPIVRWRDPLEGWTVASGDAFYLQPTFWDNSLARGSDPSGFGGNSWIGTYELFTGPLQVGFPGLAAGDAPRGSIRSAPFTVSGNRMSLRVGGGNDIDRLYVALYTAIDSHRQLRSTGGGSDTMQEVTWDVGAWYGQPVFLEIADYSSDLSGHINVDEIVEFNDTASDVASVGPRVLALHANVPNPFNPATRIAIDLPSDGRTRLSIFDVRGRLVRSLVAGRLPAGRHEVGWNGTGENGQRVASGLYLYRLEFEDEAPQVRSMLLVK